VAAVFVGLLMAVAAIGAQAGLARAGAKSAHKPAGLPEIVQQAPELPDRESTSLKLREILSRPEFAADYGKPPDTSLLERLWEFLKKLFGPLGLVGWSPIGYVAVLLMTALVVFLLTKMIWEFSVHLRARATEADESEPPPPTVEAMLKAAAEAAARGDFRQAVRLRFNALVSSLGLPSVALRTNHQILRNLAQDCPPARSPMAELVACFEDAWYGAFPCGGTDYAMACSLATTVEQAVKGAEA
jgi:hypothetical protein